MSKEYIFGELEKLTADEKYYMKSPAKMRDFSNKTSDLLEKLKNYELDSKEKKEMFKLLDALKKLRSLLR